MAFIHDFRVDNPGEGNPVVGSTPTQGTGWTLVKDGQGEFVGSPPEESISLYNSGGGSGWSTISCDSQGSSDHATIHIFALFAFNPDTFGACVRLVDATNFVCGHLYGTGSAGRRLTHVENGSPNFLVESQGVDEEWIKVEAEGDKYRLYQGGTGSSPVWAQVGSEQTVSDTALSTSEVRQGISSNTTDSLELWRYFEAQALETAGTTVDVSAELAATGSPGANLQAQASLSGEVTGQGSLTGDLVGTNTRTLSAGLTGVSSFDASLLATEGLAGDVAGVGDASFQVGKTETLSAEVPGVGSLSMAVADTLIQDVSGELAGVGSFSGDATLLRIELLSGEVAGSGSASTHLLQESLLAGEIAEVGRLSGFMFISATWREEEPLTGNGWTSESEVT